MKKSILLNAIAGVVLFATSAMAATLQIGGSSLTRDLSWMDGGMSGSNQVQTASWTQDGVEFNVTATTAAGALIPAANATLAVIGDGDDDTRIDGTEWIEFTVAVVDPTEKLTSLTVDGFSIHFLSAADRVLDVSDGATTVSISNIVNEAVVSYTNELSALTALSLSGTNTWSARFTSGDLTNNGTIGGIIINYEVPVEPPHEYVMLGGPSGQRYISYPDAGFLDGQVATGSVTTADGITFTLQVETQPGWTMDINSGGIDVIGDGAANNRIDGTEWIEWTLLSVDDPEGIVKDIKVRGFTAAFLTAGGEIFDVSDGTTTIQAGPVPADTELRYDGALLGLNELNFSTTNSWKLRVASANPTTTARFGGLVLGYTLKTPIYKLQIGGDLADRNIAWDTAGLVGGTSSGTASYTRDNVTVNVHVETASTNSLNVESGRIYIDSGPTDSNPNRITDSEWVEFSVSFDDPEDKVDTLEVDFISIDFLGAAGEAFAVTDGSATTNLVAIPTGTRISYEDDLSGLMPLTNDNTSTWSIRFTADDTIAGGPTSGSIAGFRFGFTVKTPLKIWQELYSLTGSDAELTADLEPDGLINLLEYAYGGNPNVDDAASVSPVIDAEGSWFNYVYRRRTDAADRGLEYNVYSSANLVFDPITNATAEAGSATIDSEFESVTNRVSTDVEDSQFLELEVSID